MPSGLAEEEVGDAAPVLVGEDALVDDVGLALCGSRRRSRGRRRRSRLPGRGARGRSSRRRGGARGRRARARAPCGRSAPPARSSISGRSISPRACASESVVRCSQARKAVTSDGESWRRRSALRCIDQSITDDPVAASRKQPFGLAGAPQASRRRLSITRPSEETRRVRQVCRVRARANWAALDPGEVLLEQPLEFSRPLPIEVQALADLAGNLPISRPVRLHQQIGGSSEFDGSDSTLGGLSGADTVFRHGRRSQSQSTWHP